MSFVKPQQKVVFKNVGYANSCYTKKPPFSLNVVDMFRSYRSEYTQNNGLVHQIFHNQFETRMVKFNVN